MLKIVLNDSVGAVAQWIQFYYNRILFGLKKKKIKQSIKAIDLHFYFNFSLFNIFNVKYLIFLCLEWSTLMSGLLVVKYWAYMWG